jgi:hypothetical protein
MKQMGKNHDAKLLCWKKDWEGPRITPTSVAEVPQGSFDEHTQSTSSSSGSSEGEESSQSEECSVENVVDNSSSLYFGF